MEMVEAMVVDNNYDVNSQQSNQYYHQQQHQHQVTSDRASVREDESNLVTTVRVPLSEQLPVNSKKFNEMKKTENERKGKESKKEIFQTFLIFFCSHKKVLNKLCQIAKKSFAYGSGWCQHHHFY